MPAEEETVLAKEETGDKPASVSSSTPLFEAAEPGAATWATLPTPARGGTVDLPSARGPHRSRSPHRTPDANGSKKAIYILDGLNIMRSRNHQTSGGGEVCLEWEQLERACRFYIRRGHPVSVYLPPLRPDCEPDFDRLRREFGDIFVLCRSASDDRFMINAVKLYQDAQDDLAQDSSPACYILTNDRFEDWRRRGHVDAAWVERHCIRFAFGLGGCFIPSELV